jgi:drug/metabolite transporter (DMT)-like permease
VQVAFASQAVEAKVLMLPRAAGGEGLPAFALAMARMLAGAAFFQGYWVLTRRGPPPPRLTARDHAALFGLSLLGITLNQALFLLGLGRTSPFAAALLSATIPVCTAGLSAALGLERLRARTVFGLGVAIAGVLVLTGLRTIDRGAALVALNSLLYASYLVLGRSTIVRLGALRVVTWVFTYGAITFAPFALPELVAAAPELTTRGTWLLLYILAMPTIVAYLLNAWALGRSTPTLVTVYIYLQPLIAGLLAYVQLGQALSSRMGTAGVLVLVGVTIVATRRAEPLG